MLLVVPCSPLPEASGARAPTEAWQENHVGGWLQSNPASSK